MSPAKSASLQEQVNIALDLEKKGELRKASEKLRSVLDVPTKNSSDPNVRIKENAVYTLANLYVAQKDATSLSTLLKALRPFFQAIPKAKTAKIVRTVIDELSRIEGSEKIQAQVCQDSIQWAKDEKRTFLRQRIEVRLAQLQYEQKQFQSALELVENLVREVKRLDDKSLLVEVHLLESHIQHSLRNFPKARGSLTAARTAANAIYIPPLLQAQIDQQSGILHAEERDYKTAYSYFYEAFESYHSLKGHESEAVHALKYRLLTKIMGGKPEEARAVLATKAAMMYSMQGASEKGSREVEAMRRIALAYEQRSLKDFEDTLQAYEVELKKDALVNSHLNALYESLLRENIVRVIEPFSAVQLDYIAEQVSLPRNIVEQKLSLMILDGTIAGILDQGQASLVIFEGAKVESLYPDGLQVMEVMNRAVDNLWEMAKVVPSV